MNVNTHSAEAIEEISLEELEALIAETYDDKKAETKTVKKEVIDNVTEASEVVDEFSLDAELEALEVSKDFDFDLDDILESVIKDVELSESKLETYSKQDENAEHLDFVTAPSPANIEASTETLEVSEEKAEKKKAPKEKKEPRKTTYTHDRATLAEDRGGKDFYLLETSDFELSDDEKLAKHDQIVEKIKKMNVKVGAKCLNLLAYVNDKAELSVFMQIALKYAITNHKLGGSCTQAGLVACFIDKELNGVKSYAKSTALPQAANCFAVFEQLSVIKRVEGSSAFAINTGSTVVAKFSRAAS